jgi:electron transport complex protein RnfC
MPDSPPVEPPSSVPAFRPMPGVSTLPPARGTARPALSDIADWRSRLIDAGVIVNRIASPDLTRQLEHASRANVDIDTVICSVLDTDPSVPFNAAIAEAYPEEIAAGVHLLSQLTGSPRIWITADPDKPADWFSQIQSRIDIRGLKLVPLRGDYPQTDPTLMLYTLLQRRLAPGKLPTEKGAVLVDAAAALAIGRCVLFDAPVRHTPLAVRDHFLQRTHLLDVPMGVRLQAVCEFLEIHHFDAVYRAGDFLRDAWMTPETRLGTGELVIHPTAKHLNANPDPCIRCGWCLEACPTRIHPAGLLDAAQQNDMRAAKKFGLDGCIECGICSYVCPTRLPLLTAIKGLKRG